MLAGSTSLTSTVTSLVKLRIFSVLGIALIVIWAFSPIGGQASFRQLSLGSTTNNESTSFTYMVNGANMFQYDDSDRQTYFQVTNGLFIASIIAPLATKLSSTDTWGNVKVPFIEPYENATTPDEQGWYAVNGNDTVYSSLVGIPISGTDRHSVFHVANVETSYIQLECPIVNGKWITAPDDGLTCGTGACMWSTDNSTRRVESKKSELKPRSLIYETWDVTGCSQCSMTTTYVEIEVKCLPTSKCAVSKLRRSRGPHPPPAYVSMDSYWHSWDLFRYAFVTSVVGHPTYPTVVQYYLKAPEDPMTRFLAALNGASSKAKPPSDELFALRLGQLINTYWTCLQAWRAITGGMTPETAYMEGTNTSASFGHFLTNSSTTSGSRSHSTPVIESHSSWVITLLVASLIMVIASLISPVVRIFLTRGPDIMFNISGLATRNSAFVSLPENGTFMASSDRARLLKNTKVRFGDVEGDSDVGRLAIGSLDAHDALRVEAIRKSRHYI